LQSRVHDLYFFNIKKQYNKKTIALSSKLKKRKISIELSKKDKNSYNTLKQLLLSCLDIKLWRMHMNTSNPALTANSFLGLRATSPSDVMTMGGTANKTVILLLLALLPATYVWKLFLSSGQNPAAIQTWMWGGLIGGLILSLVTVFKKNWAPITAPLYAVMEGLFLGGISAQFQMMYPGIALQAISLTLATLLMMLAAYQSGWIQPSENFKLGIVAATGGIMVVYLVSMVLSFFGIPVPLIQGSGLFSILFSGFVCIIAALNLILDFDFIREGARNNLPKYMEWYGAFALMVTLVWLYLEILRLLAKLNDRK